MSHPGRWQLVGAFAATYLCWGATFLAIRWAVEDFPPLVLIAVRCGGGALLLGLWLHLSGRWAPTKPANLARAALAGLFLFLGCHGVLAWAEQRVSSGQAAIYLTTIPIWLVGFDAMSRRTWPPVPVLAALALGTVGVGLLTGKQNGADLGERLGLTVAAASWAAGSLIGRADKSPVSAGQRSVLQLTAGAVWVGGASLLAGEPRSWQAHSVGLTAAVSLGFLIVFGTVLGFAAYTWLLGVVSPAAAGSYAYVNPLVALLLGVAVGDDRLTVRVAVAAVAILTSVAVVQIPWSRSRRA